MLKHTAYKACNLRLAYFSDLSHVCRRCCYPFELHVFGVFVRYIGNQVGFTIASWQTMWKLKGGWLTKVGSVVSCKCRRGNLRPNVCVSFLFRSAEHTPLVRKIKHPVGVAPCSYLRFAARRDLACPLPRLLAVHLATPSPGPRSCVPRPDVKRKRMV